MVARPLSAWSCIALLLAACTSHRTTEPDPGPEPEPDPQRPIVETPASLVSPSREPLLAWRWIHWAEDGGPFTDVGPRSLTTGGIPCAYVHDDDAHTAGRLCCEAQPRWCVDLREDFVPGVSLASDGVRLFVADYPAISSGGRFVAYDLRTGTQLWEREALAIGPQAHSEYFNVVQLRVVGDAVIASGAESHGGYVEAMDAETGAVLRHATLEPPEVPWIWAAAPEPEPEVELALADGGRCRYAIPEDGPATLACEGPGAGTWALELEPEFVGRGALAAADDRLILVSWCRIANGARARAFALADGELAWDRPLEGIGPQDHSKYSNLIRLEIADELAIVRGLESHGRYVEARELASGELRYSIVWPTL